LKRWAERSRRSAQWMPEVSSNIAVTVYPSIFCETRCSGAGFALQSNPAQGSIEEALQRLMIASSLQKLKLQCSRILDSGA
jgi:hypothetical protein